VVVKQNIYTKYMYIPLMVEYKNNRIDAEKIKKELKEEWMDLWFNKYDDKKLSEGISTKNYDKLSVIKGEVIYASKKCNSLEFSQLLETHLGHAFGNVLNPPSDIGGYRKFARENLSNINRKQREKPKIKFDTTQQQRKGGRGWLNQNRLHNKKKD